MKSGIYTFWWPVALKRVVQLALDVFPDRVADGWMIMQPLTLE